MTDCKGDGSCFEQCCCICFEDDECEVPSELCTCGHREHANNLLEGEYCQYECPHGCKLVECHNFRLCGKKEPQWFLNCYHGMCHQCTIMIGKIKFMDTKDDCPICMENKNMIEVCCGKHHVCLDCWLTLSNTKDSPIPLSCPLCRKSIWKYE